MVVDIILPVMAVIMPAARDLRTGAGIIEIQAAITGTAHTSQAGEKDINFWL